MKAEKPNMKKLKKKLKKTTWKIVDENEGFCSLEPTNNKKPNLLKRIIKKLKSKLKKDKK